MKKISIFYIYNIVLIKYFSNISKSLILLSIGFFSVVFSFFCYAQPIDNQYQQYIPSGWNLIKSVEGDLTKDEIKGVALVIQKNDPKNLIKNESLGSDILNINPRRLIILALQKDQLKPILIHDTFIPSESSEENPALLDPFKDIKIKNNLLIIVFEELQSTGGWYCSENEFKFRYNQQNNRFRLIGYEHNGHMRNSGEKKRISKNYLSGKQVEITGSNEFKKSTVPVKTIWSKIKENNEIYLDEIKNRFEFYDE